ncbi:Dyp-type peroxidase family protein [Corynebacterium kutscheri]|uniref:Dyp-type peroxidase family n=1 Tax=Corynebacterium kutscheri TaxID=35755 RepID=A0A0F6QZV7_9CORY|nr:Dyp-type peroxidase [Corynebacterium kutscheri]AKE41357.1 Dyp-type peroxidase family [Corynebacterium kutscheri]VEH08633.1 Dyp-type peroxidase family protein [Corynebacterium kutscheri]VEH09679.1 Dyp-type peroxidase family protein [Corynebacterium kutscheri]VEH79762.1 Dyp-type peroxidase family protein [Corynebacterium kutscheri]
MSGFDTQSQQSISRRGFLLGTAGIAGATGLSACSHGQEASVTQSLTHDVAADTLVGDSTVEFHGLHQAGIATGNQASQTMVAFNFRAGSDRKSAQRLMRLWTEDARRLCQGLNPLGSLEPEMTTHPAKLTITVGLGERFFDFAEIAHMRPSWLKDMPVFENDQLDDAYGQADLVLQIASNDPVTTAWAVRHMTRAGSSIVTTRWFQTGFLNAQGVLEKGATPRNLFGQKDGTINPRTDEDFYKQVWISSEDAELPWLVGGTSLVVRRIAMNLDKWEMLDRTSREVVIGRTLDSGAPLSGTDEFDEADFEARDSFGLPVIDARSHMALAAPPSDAPEQRILRRAYNYNEAPIAGSDQLSNAGLVFGAYQKNPLLQFLPIQQRLSASDRLNEWITHIGSAVFVIPPGVDENHYWAQEILES